MHSGLAKEASGALHAWLNLNKETNQAMTKSLEVITEAVRNPKHPFRKVDNQPKKPKNIAMNAGRSGNTCTSAIGCLEKQSRSTSIPTSN